MVCLRSRIYIGYSEETVLVVYDLISGSWSEIADSYPSAVLAADDEFIYVVGQTGLFKKLTPVANVWSPRTDTGLSGDQRFGGLEYQDGYLYHHVKDSNAFQRYRISSHTWEPLPDLPGNAMHGSTLTAGYYFAIIPTNMITGYHLSEGQWNDPIPTPVGYSDEALASDFNHVYIIGNSSGNPNMGQIDLNMHWMRTTQERIMLPAGMSVNVPLTFDGGELYGGTYTGNIVVYDGVRPFLRHRIPVDLNVFGDINLTVDPNSLHLEALPNTSDTATFTITSTGTDRLDIDSITSDNVLFTTDFAPTSLNTGENLVVTVTFSPLATGDNQGTLTISGNFPTRTVSLTGRGLIPTTLNMTPASITEILETDETSQRQILFENLGEVPLEASLTLAKGSAQSILVIGEEGFYLRGILEAMGIQVTLARRIENYTGSLDPHTFDGVILAVGDTIALDMPADGQQTLLDYVENGGGMMVFSQMSIAIQLGLFSILAEIMPLHGGNDACHNYTYRIQENHPVTQGLSDFTLASCDAFTTANQGTTLINTTFGPAVVANTPGLGRLLQFSAELDGNNRPLDNEDFETLFRNSLAWITSDWVSLPQHSVSVDPGASTMVAVNLDATGLDEGTYQKTMLIHSNDPTSPHSLPIQLTIFNQCALDPAFYSALPQWPQTATVLDLIPLAICAP